MLFCTHTLTIYAALGCQKSINVQKYLCRSVLMIFIDATTSTWQAKACTLQFGRSRIHFWLVVDN